MQTSDKPLPTGSADAEQGSSRGSKSITEPSSSYGSRKASPRLGARALRWNVETIGFSPNGFNGYFLFKILLCAFTAMVFLQAMAIFYRSLLEWREGEDSENKYLDRDSLGEGEEAYEGTH